MTSPALTLAGSTRFLVWLGHPSDDSYLPTAFQAAQDLVRNALQNPNSPEPPGLADAVTYLIDYCNGTGTTNDPLPSPSDINAVNTMLYGTGNSGGLLDSYAASRTTSNGISDAIAPLFTARTVEGAPNPFGTEAARLKLIETALMNSPNAPPPVSVIEELVRNATMSTGDGGALSTYGAVAQVALEHWFSYASVNNIPVKPELIAAYKALYNDPQFHAHGMVAMETTINNLTGDARSRMMEILRQVNPSDTQSSFTSSGTAPDHWGDFGAPPTPVVGWAYLAMQTLENQLNSGSHFDDDLLAKLNAVNPWAAAYISNKALGIQWDNREANPVYDPNEDFDPECLDILQQYDTVQGTTHAHDLALASLIRSALPTNRLLDANDPTGISSTGLTNNPRPTVLVDLNGMGSPPPAAGDIVYLYDGDTYLGQVQVTDQDVRNHRVSVTLAPDVPDLLDGTHQLTTKFRDSTGTMSPLSTPLPVTIATAFAPTFVRGARSQWSYTADAAHPGHYNISANVGFNGAAGLAPPLNASDFEFTVEGSDFALHTVRPTRVSVDYATGTLHFEFDNVDVGTAHPGNVYLNVIPPLKDFAGNVVTLYPGGGRLGYRLNHSLTPVTLTPVDAQPPLPLKYGRHIDMNAYNLLKKIDPATADRYLQQLRNAGLADQPATPPAPTLRPRLIDFAFDILMWRSDLNKEELEYKLKMLKKANMTAASYHEFQGLETALMDLAGQDPTKRLIDVIAADTLGPQVEKINAMLSQLGLTQEMFHNSVGIIVTQTQVPGSNPPTYLPFTNVKDLRAAIDAINAKIEAQSNMSSTLSVESQKDLQTFNECLKLLGTLLQLWKEVIDACMPKP